MKNQQTHPHEASVPVEETMNMQKKKKKKNVVTIKKIKQVKGI